MTVRPGGSALRDTFSFAGGVAGLVVFLTLVLNAAMAYGGAAGIAIVHGLGLSAPSEELASRIIVWTGMLLGALATAALLIILGAVLGALVYGLVGRRFAEAARSQEEQR